MHEFLLFGQVPEAQQQQLRQQLIGITRMQPRNVTELHLVFKAKALPPLTALPSSTGGNQGVISPEVLKTRNMLNGSLYYIQLVGQVRHSGQISEFGVTIDESKPSTTNEVKMDDVNHSQNGKEKAISWFLDFRDTPDPGKQVVTSRLMCRVPVVHGNPIKFLQDFGYEYVYRYILIGDKFFDQNITLFLYRVFQLSSTSDHHDDSSLSSIPVLDSTNLLDSSGSFILQTSIEASDGNNPELKGRATNELLAMKDTLKEAVDLSPRDRLSMDTKLPTMQRR